MKPINQTTSSEKFKIIHQILKKYSEETSEKAPQLLDIGCRDCVLSEFVPSNICYSGLDLCQNSNKTVAYVGSFPKDFSFKPEEFNITCAVDCLEHMDELQTSLEEILKITSETSLIVLPNMAHVFYRFKFLLTGKISGKYDLYPLPGQDRHRWLTVQKQSTSFMKSIAARNGFDCSIINIKENQFMIGRIGYFLSKVFNFLGPDWSAWSTLYILNRIKIPD